MARGRLTVVHRIPGRLRLRLPEGAEVPGLEREVHAHPGVKRVRHSPRARSVVVEYQPAETTPEALLELMAALTGVDVDPLDTAQGVLPAPLSQTITRAVSTLNAEVAKRTSHHLDMRTLLGMSLCAWAGAQILRGRARSLPWSQALWYGYELFRHHTRDVTLRPAAGGGPAPVRAVISRRHRQ